MKCDYCGTRVSGIDNCAHCGAPPPARQSAPVETETETEYEFDAARNLLLAAAVAAVMGIPVVYFMADLQIRIEQATHAVERMERMERK